jgi:hypothetical protein
MSQTVSDWSGSHSRHVAEPKPASPSKQRLSQLETLESESIYILREAAAVFEPGDAVFDWQRLLRHAAARAKGVLPRQDSVSSAGTSTPATNFRK